MAIGPWTRAEVPGFKAGLKESFQWYDAYLRGNRAALRSSPVCVYVVGIKKWVDLPSWPPHSAANRVVLAGGRQIVTGGPCERARTVPVSVRPSQSDTRHWRSSISDGGLKGNRKLEARNDALTLTSKPMPRHLPCFRYRKMKLQLPSLTPRFPQSPYPCASCCKFAATAAPR